MSNDIVVVIGAGGIGLAIARRQGFGKTVLLADFDEKRCSASPAKRWPPEEITVAASYLLGPDAGFVTGSDLLIDGCVIAAMMAGEVPTPG